MYSELVLAISSLPSDFRLSILCAEYSTAEYINNFFCQVCFPAFPFYFCSTLFPLNVS